jgi:hypothetical protein
LELEMAQYWTVSSREKLSVDYSLIHSTFI